MHFSSKPSTAGLQRRLAANHASNLPARGSRVIASYGAGRGRGRGSSNPGNDMIGLILGPGANQGVSKEFQQHLANRKIIIPGGPSRPAPGAPAQLVVPDEEMGGVSGILDASDSVTTPTPPSRYRPPAGFMNDSLHEDETANMTSSEMLNRLQTRAGRWYTLGKMITSLNKQNFDSSVISESTGISPAEQNKWVVAGTVYDSLRLSGKVPADVLSAFDDDGFSLLEPFRFLSVDFRAAAALYIVEKRLGPEECDVLARAMKEWDRRVSERQGFSDHPGDCMAFKYLRDALEMRTEVEAAQKVQLGLKAAVTEGAKARLNEVLKPEGEPGAAPTATTGNMLLLRLNEEEIGYRTLPLIGAHGSVRVRDVQVAPKSSQSGPFGVFTLHGAEAVDVSWVALPQWKALTQARHPIAVEVPDCSKVPAILLGTKVKTDEERKRLQGPGMLVLEAGKVSPTAASGSEFYLANTNAEASLDPSLDKVELVDGTRLKASGKTAVATLLFLCRPPVREGIQPDTPHLLQL